MFAVLRFLEEEFASALLAQEIEQMSGGSEKPGVHAVAVRRTTV
jgi:hypothetical protein